MTKHIDIVFDGPPSMPAPRFVEVEDDQQRSIRFGEWIARDDGFWVLRITPDSLTAAIADPFAGIVDVGVNDGWDA